MRVYKYTCKKSDVVYAEFYIHDDGHMEWATQPSDLTADSLSAMLQSSGNATNRLHQCGYSEISVKTVTNG